MTGRFEIVGGVYRERCIHPLWDNVFGSAGRAVPCVSAQIPSGVRLHAYIAPSIEPEARQLVAESAVELVPAPADDEIAFDYLHPLAIPRITPSLGSIRRRPPIRVQGEVVLRYGMLEGDAVVDTQIAVYDPQSAFGADPFSANGSRAGRLAVVMNRSEARSMTGLSDPAAAASYLIGSGEAEVVVIKEGARGASVTTRSGSHRVPAYRSARVWKIGSGDVFSASFAALWAGSEADPVEAADLASRATAAGAVRIEWDEARKQFDYFVKLFMNLVEATFPNCNQLSDDSFGALTSIVYNRGNAMRSAMNDPIDRRREMREIRALMQAEDFTAIPDRIRSMKRVWRNDPDSRGLLLRRDAEAQLFQSGLGRA